MQMQARMLPQGMGVDSGSGSVTPAASQLCTNNPDNGPFTQYSH